MAKHHFKRRRDIFLPISIIFVCGELHKTIYSSALAILTVCWSVACDAVARACQAVRCAGLAGCNQEPATHSTRKPWPLSASRRRGFSFGRNILHRKGQCVLRSASQIGRGQACNTGCMHPPTACNRHVSHLYFPFLCIDKKIGNSPHTTQWSASYDPHPFEGPCIRCSSENCPSFPSCRRLCQTRQKEYFKQAVFVGKKIQLCSTESLSQETYRKALWVRVTSLWTSSFLVKLFSSPAYFKKRQGHKGVLRAKLWGGGPIAAPTEISVWSRANYSLKSRRRLADRQAQPHNML